MVEGDEIAEAFHESADGERDHVDARSPVADFTPGDKEFGPRGDGGRVREGNFGKGAPESVRTSFGSLIWLDLVEFFGFLFARLSKEVVILQPHPVFGFVAEVSAQFEADFRAEESPFGEEIVQQLRADADVPRELCLAEIMVGKKIAQ